MKNERLDKLIWAAIKVDNADIFKSIYEQHNLDINLPLGDEISIGLIFACLQKKANKILQYAMYHEVIPDIHNLMEAIKYKNRELTQYCADRVLNPDNECWNNHNDLASLAQLPAETDDIFYAKLLYCDFDILERIKELKEQQNCRIDQRSMRAYSTKLLNEAINSDNEVACEAAMNYSASVTNAYFFEEYGDAVLYAISLSSKRCLDILLNRGYSIEDSGYADDAFAKADEPTKNIVRKHIEYSEFEEDDTRKNLKVK